MPGYVIHLSVAKSYMRKHENEIQNENEFILGTITPDFVKDKSETHYGPKSSKVNLRKYLEENEIISDFDKGYFLHLVTDYIFYNRIIDTFSKDIYNDYDILNKYLIEKYEIEIPDRIKNEAHFKSGETKILSKEKADETIEVVSNFSLSNIRKEILDSNYCKKWEELRPLKRLD